MTEIRLPQRYNLIHEIGSGGGGDVFAVFDLKRSCKLALKVFKVDDSDSFNEQDFFDEYLLCLKLKSKSLIDVYDYGYTEDSRPYYTMELLPDPNIDDQVNAENPEKLVTAISKCSEAIAFLHHFNLVHNDLKPANVKLVESDEEINVKLLDFGLAIDYSPDNLNSKLSGTVEYMAPELFENHSSDNRSDMYSLGVMLYKLISGMLPFEDDDPLKVISRKLEEEVPKLDSNGIDLPDELLGIVSDLLNRDPEQRPDNAWQFAQACAELVEDDDLKFDFRELLSTAIHLKLASDFQKFEYHKGNGGIFCFHDRKVLESFQTILRAFLQKDKYVVSDYGDHDNASQPGSKKAVIQVTTQSEQLPDKVEPDCYYLYLVPQVKIGTIPAEATEIKFDVIQETQKWFDPEMVTSEFTEKLQDLSSDSIDTLALVLNEMQAVDSIGYNGYNWEVDTTEFIEYSPSKEILSHALKVVDKLGADERASLRRLAIINHEFDEQFYIKFEMDHSYEPARMLNRFVENGLLSSKNHRYRLKNQILRVAILSENDKKSLKKLHIKAAEIAKKSAVYTREQKALYTARHYTLAEQLQEALRWTLKAVEHRLAANQYRFALKLVKNCLNVAHLFTKEEDSADQIARLLSVKGDIENKLGYTNTALASFAGIVRLKRRIIKREYLAAAYKHLGDIYKSRMDYRRGLKALKEALAIYKETCNKIELSHTYNNLGNMYWVGNKIDLALEVYFKALEIQEELNLQKDIASTLSNIGSCYVMKHQYDKTIEHYKRSIEIKKKINDRPELARTYNNLGVTYHEIGKVKEALGFLYDALKINREIDSTREIMFNLDNIASCELTLGNYQKVESLAQEGLATATELNDTVFQVMFMVSLSSIYIQTGEFVEAERILDQAENSMARINDSKSKLLLYLNYTRLFFKLCEVDKFNKYLNEALSEATDSEDLHGIANCMALKCSAAIEFENDMEKASIALKKGFEAIKDLEYNNLLGVLYLAKMTRDLQSEFDEDFEYMDRLGELMDDPVNANLKPQYYYLMALMRMKLNQLEDASKLFNQALKLTEQKNQKNLMWKIKFQHGNLKQKLFNYEDAYLSYREAVTILKNLAQNIDNKNYLESFIKQPMAIKLKRKITALANKMGSKQESRP